MLTILGFAMIATFLVLIMMKKMSPIAALVLIPALFCVLVGQGAQLGDYVVDGVGKLAPTAAMLMFATRRSARACSSSWRWRTSSAAASAAGSATSPWTRPWPPSPGPRSSRP